MIAGVSLVAAVISCTLWLRGANAPRATERLMLEIGPPSGEEFVVQSNAGTAVVSPDGSMVAFIAQGPAARRLYVRSLVTGEARAISGTEEASYPFWSPDSRSLAFFGRSQLLTVSIAGGLPEAIADIEQGAAAHGQRTASFFTPRGGGARIASGYARRAVKNRHGARPQPHENAHYWPVASRRPRLPVLIQHARR
jgi:hypothetical protein